MEKDTILKSLLVPILEGFLYQGLQFVINLIIRYLDKANPFPGRVWKATGLIIQEKTAGLPKEPVWVARLWYFLIQWWRNRGAFNSS